MLDLDFEFGFWIFDILPIFTFLTFLTLVIGHCTGPWENPGSGHPGTAHRLFVIQ